MKRRRSVKISSVALEPAQWQNDALQILTCANDYKSMNEFLMKKVLLQLALVYRFRDLKIIIEVTELMMLKYLMFHRLLI